MRVLLVEDDADYAEVLTRWLAREGLDVERATDGIDAFDRLTSGTFDAAVIDLLLPAVDGRELLACIRADARLADLKVVVHTALPMTPERAETLSAANAVVEKAGFVLPLVRTLRALVPSTGAPASGVRR
jgi:CheY-like chemotaxis protein